MRDEDVRLAAPPRDVRDRSGVGRPRRKSIQRAAGRDPPLVLAVVVGDVDLLDRAVLNGAGQPLAVAIGRIRQLGARDAHQRALLQEDLVRNRVRVLARIGRAGVLRAHRRAPRSHFQEPEADLEPGARLLHGPHEDSVGVEFAPPVERRVVERLRDRNRRVDVAGDERELMFVVQVFPQDVGDRLGGGDRFGIVRERQKCRHGVAWRRAGLALDRRLDVAGLLRGCLRGHSGQTGEDREGSNDVFHRVYGNLT